MNHILVGEGGTETDVGMGPSKQVKKGGSFKDKFKQSGSFKDKFKQSGKTSHTSTQVWKGERRYRSEREGMTRTMKGKLHPPPTSTIVTGLGCLQHSVEFLINICLRDPSSLTRAPEDS